MITEQRLKEIKEHAAQELDTEGVHAHTAAAWTEALDLINEVEYLARMVHDLQEESTAYALGKEEGIKSGLNDRKYADLGRLLNLKHELVEERNVMRRQLGMPNDALDYAIRIVEELSSSMHAERQPLLSNAGPTPSSRDPYAGTTVAAASGNSGPVWTSDGSSGALHPTERELEALRQAIRDLQRAPQPKEVIKPLEFPTLHRHGHISGRVLEDLQRPQQYASNGSDDAALRQAMELISKYRDEVK